MGNTNLLGPEYAALAFSGRKADVVLFANLGQEGEHELEGRWLHGPEQSGSVCTGVLKLVQWILLELLTEYGQDLYEPERGTRLMQLAQRGWLKSGLEAMQAVSLSIPAVERALAGVSEWPDENLDSLTVLQADLGSQPGSVVVYLQVNTSNGEERQVIVPLSGVGLVLEEDF